jgi:hypothetical protein
LAEDHQEAVIRRRWKQTTQVTPYAPAQPALNQILSEAGQLYGQGVGASGYVAPSQQTLSGLAQQEQLGTAANQQMAATLGGQYLNPFLSPLLQQQAGNIYTNVAQQFSGAGRTPGSPMMQNQVVSQVANAALPLAFQEYGQERGRQLGLSNSNTWSNSNRSSIRKFTKTTTNGSISIITTICRSCFTNSKWFPSSICSKSNTI